MHLDEADLEDHHCIAYGYTDGQVDGWYFGGRQSGDQEGWVIHP